MGSTVRVLIIEDNPGDAGLIQLALAAEPRGSYSCYQVPRLSAGMKRLEQAETDVVLLDLGLPDTRGMDGLTRLRAKAPDLPIVVLTGAEDPELVGRAMASGADDYQVKGRFPPGLLGRIVRSAIQRRRLEEGLRTDEFPDVGLLSTLTELGEGVAILDGDRVALVSDAFSEITGWPQSELSAVPAWLTRLLRASPQIDPGSRAQLAGGSHPYSTSGTLTLDRKDGLPVRVEYAFRVIGGKRSRHFVFWLRESRLRRIPPDVTLGGLTFEPEPP